MQLKEVEQFKQISKDLSILMVDDEVTLTENYLGIAQRFFKHVQIANSADKVIECFEKKRFDIIYTDLNMPGIDGIELIQTIKKIDPKQIFIVISASDESDKLMQLIGLNISGFILKPFTIDNFIQVSMEQTSILLQSRSIEEKSEQLHNDLLQVTQEKQVQEKMLIQQSKLAQTGEMISMIAHQWRQPLSSISAALATLKVRIELDTYEQSKSPVTEFSSDFDETHKKVENTVGYLSRTIDDFRNFYRPDNEKKLFKLCDSLESVLGMLNLKNRQIEVVLKCEKFEIYTFEGELKQVIMSIINNAADALLQNVIKEPKVSISTEGKDDNILLCIMDNAGGIPENIIDDIFLPYFSTKDEKNGTGLGLHMAKTIIEKHVKGSLSVKNSTQFGGAEFMISIPKTTEE